MKIITNLNFDQNTYIFSVDEKVVVVDPGYNSKEIIQYFGTNKPDLILLTHYHFDHVASVNELCQKYGIKAMINKADYELLLNNDLAQSMGLTNPEIDKENIVSFEDEIKDLPSIEIIQAPGHSEGSTLFVYEKTIFTGDVLFADTYGRTDLLGSDNQKQITTLKSFNKLNGELVVCPGHGRSEMLANIIKNNNFF